MCELYLGNTGDAELNRLMFLLVGSLGSVEHKDGWGFSDGTHSSKCEFPMFYDERVGQIMRKTLGKAVNKPLLGHIRKASWKVPVTEENAHPFVEHDITFAHNGTLKPYDEKKYPTEYWVEEENPTTKKMEKRLYGYSDSKIFFDAFLNNFTSNVDIVTALNQTMADFHGKFAFLISVKGQFYIARGKTANLYISYRMDRPGEQGVPIGYVIHTNNKLLDTCEILAANIFDLQGKEEIFFSPPILLKENTVFVAEKSNIREIGELKENYPPVAKGWEEVGAKNPTKTGSLATTTKGAAPISATDLGKLDKMFKQVYEWMKAFSLSTRDIQTILMEIYGSSTQETQEAVLKNFIDKVMPLLSEKTDKALRKRLRKALGNVPLGLTQYHKWQIEFPWFLNSRAEQIALIEALEGKVEVEK